MRRTLNPLPSTSVCLAALAALAATAAPARAQTDPNATVVTIGGYVKLDAIVSSDSSGNPIGDAALIPGLIPLDSVTHNDNQFKAHARQSRFFMRTQTPTEMGALTTLIEFDLYGSSGTESNSNSHNPRLRHAVGSLGGFSAGQTWTNFMFLPSYAETLDFGGHAAQIFVRQAQVRWTQKTAGGQWSLSLENPDASFAQPGSAALVTQDDDRVPDIVGQIVFGAGKRMFSVQAMARNLRIDSAAAPAATDDKWGGALGVSGVVPVGRDDFKFGIDAGNALGRYAGVSFFADGVIDAGGRIQLPDQYVWRAAYRHWWTEKLRSSLVISGGKSDNPAGTAAGVNREIESLHVNLIWSPVPKVNTGVELLTAKRTVEGGAEGTLTRLQFSAQYNF